MLNITCPTCDKLLGDLVLIYEKNKDEICNNPKYTEEEKELKIQELVKDFELRYCCKMRLISYKDIVEDILPIPKDK